MMGEYNGSQESDNVVVLKHDLAPFLESLSLDSLQERDKGLSGLKRILELHRGKSQLAGLEQEYILDVYQLLFRHVSSERSSYIQANRATLQAALANRLSNYAAAVLSLTSAFLPVIRALVLRRILDHIFQSLPVPARGFCDPLISSYTKTLCLLLEHAPHLEHLSGSKWLEAVDFCLSDPNGSVGDSRTTKLSQYEADGTTGLVRCLSLLASSPNGRQHKRAQEIFDHCLPFLRLSSSINATTIAALSTIKHVLRIMSANSTSFMNHAVVRYAAAIRSLWRQRGLLHKDEILISLLYCEPHIQSSLLRHQSGEHDISQSLEAILNDMTHDYRHSISRERRPMNLDDLAFVDIDRPLLKVLPMQNPSFYLHKPSQNSERVWAMLHLMAFFSSCLDYDSSISDEHTDPNDDDPASTRKRRRVSTRLQDLLSDIAGVVHEAKPHLIHLLCFVIHQRKLNVDDLESILSVLLPILSVSDAHSASWALVAIVCCGDQSCANETVLSSFWRTIWHHASRLLTTQAHCRSACRVMKVLQQNALVPSRDIADSISAILNSININGPVEACDTALEFLCLATTFASMHLPGALSDNTFESLLNWLFGKWKPSGLEDKAWLEHVSTTCSIRQVSLLFTPALIHKSKTISISMLPTFGSIGDAWHFRHYHKQLLDYLLLRDATSNQSTYFAEQSTNYVKSAVASTVTTTPKQDDLILTYLHMEVDKIQSKLTSDLLSRSSSHSRIACGVVFSFCVLAGFIASHSASRHTPKNEDLKTKCLQAIKIVTVGSFDPNKESSIDDDSLLQVIAIWLPEVQSTAGTIEAALDFEFLQNVVRVMVQSMDGYKEANEARNDALSFAEIVLDNEFDASAAALPLHTDRPDRYGAAADRNWFAFSACTMLYVRFIALCMNVDVLQSAANIPLDFINFLIKLPIDKFLAVRPVLRMLLNSAYCLTSNAIQDLFLHIEDNVLFECYTFERSDSAAGLCTDLLKATMHTWTDLDSGVLATDGADLYKWILKISIHSPPAIQSGVADLLLELLRTKADYVPDETSRSVRTELFEILREGDVVVQHHIGNHIHSVFSLFVAERHDLVFEDVLKSLPQNIEHIEGMLVRLFVLSQIASHWRNLIRQCLYRIVETTNAVSKVAKYAESCVKDIAKSVYVEEPKNLFRLYGPQMIYTWLKSQPLRTLPWGVFGYQDFRRMVQDIPSEIVAQLIVTGDVEELNNISAQLDTTTESLVQSSFAQAAAYAIATDTGEIVSMRPCESRLHKILGKAQFATLLASSTSLILGNIFLHLEGEDNFARVLQKRPDYAAAALIYKEICAAGQSRQQLTPGLQPAFQCKCFLVIIDRLCRRLSLRVEELWTCTTTFTVVRMLLDDIQPAYGPHHNRRVVLRIRLLLSLAGVAALDGYVLELLLRSLRPLVADAVCAEDVFGCLHHLFQGGKQYLAGSPSVLAGIGVATMLTLKNLLQTPPASTTQDLQYREMQSQGSRLYAWLGRFLQTVTPTSKDRSAHLRLQLYTSAVQTATPIGNAESGTPESALLMLLLEDLRPSCRFLDGPSHVLCFLLLCKRFDAPSSWQSDVLGNDRIAAENRDALWTTCQYSGLSHHYTVWALHALGRAYSYNTMLPRSILPEWDVSQITVRRVDNSSTSMTAIVHHVLDLLRNEDLDVVRGAESYLRNALYPRHDESIHSNIANYLPQELLKLFSSKTTLVPMVPTTTSKDCSMSEAFHTISSADVATWACAIVRTLCHHAVNKTVFLPVLYLLERNQSTGPTIFRYVVHLLLLSEWKNSSNIRHYFSVCVQQCLTARETSTVAHLRLLLDTVLYLRAQTIPGETTVADRNYWLELDWLGIADAAHHCGMSKASLLFAELMPARVESKRTSASTPVARNNLLLSIYRDLDEPDSFYGVDREASLDAVAEQLSFEGSGTKQLLFRGAKADSLLRSNQKADDECLGELIHALANVDMNSIIQHITSSRDDALRTELARDSIYNSAIKLQQWNLPVSTHQNTLAGINYHALQAVSLATDRSTVNTALNKSCKSIYDLLKQTGTTSKASRALFASLGSLTEVSDMLALSGGEQLRETWRRHKSRDEHNTQQLYSEASQTLMLRDAVAGIFTSNTILRDVLHITREDACLMEVDIVLHSSKTYRLHQAFQQSLTNLTYLSNASRKELSKPLGLDAAIKSETASLLWDCGESSQSIRMLQDVVGQPNADQQNLMPGKAGLLAELAHRVSEARLEKPSEILRNYLTLSLQALDSTNSGSEACNVFHEYALYCHTQLDNPEVMQDLQRSERFRSAKLAELEQLESIIVKGDNSDDDRIRVKRERQRVKVWLNIDERDYKSQKTNRDLFLQRSLDNYQLALTAADNHDIDVLRFVAIWFRHAAEERATDTVAKYIGSVPTKKFVKILNQLASRLQDSPGDKFQELLSDLVQRICLNHPYHGMNFVFAGSKTSGGNDKTAMSRHAAATQIAYRLQRHPDLGKTWSKIARSNELYIELANFKTNDMRANMKLSLHKFPAGRHLEMQVPELGIPPITIEIGVRADMDYRNIPLIASFKPDMTIAGGISAPKVLAVVTDTGAVHRQLFKGGSDDLRQDAIMEQVFGQVSDMLHTTKATRERNLRIRTYKVVPLDATCGAIEFVQPTISLNDFLVSAHERYHPRDLKWKTCREKIADAQSLSRDARVKVFKDIEARFKPVLRHFFFERFPDPDDWFERRLAYTRSTAAISVLGHALGLGDRHCQNILLDTSTGEVVHIDLGVAFEAGRVLAVPEVVPFRLTRDVVDGFGVNRTEGVFRRCCEFALEALRGNKNAIMTLLNVLRYDPLYSWSISPLRAKRLQQEQEDDMAAAAASREGSIAPTVASKASRRSRGSEVVLAQTTAGAKEPLRDPDEGGEADRALTVVERKLATGLSVTATVNELIQQAADERNLAVLYAGWAAFA